MKLHDQVNSDHQAKFRIAIAKKLNSVDMSLWASFVHPAAEAAERVMFKLLEQNRVARAKRKPVVLITADAAYTCPKCSCHELQRHYRYCQGCGSRLKWGSIEKEKELKQRLAGT